MVFCIRLTISAYKYILQSVIQFLSSNSQTSKLSGDIFITIVESLSVTIFSSTLFDRP